MKIDKQKLEQKIKEGKSSHDIAMTYDVHPSTVRRDTSRGKKVGLIAARRTGLIRGGRKIIQKDE